MKSSFVVSAAAAALFLTGCYHATIETGAKPAPEVIQNDWATGLIYGLVPPAPVETKQKCADGVSKVETQLSLPNMLASMITFGIYTPMSIKVTCAAK
jgi:hypothetical protein